MDSKDFLGGWSSSTRPNLDGALVVAEELQELRPNGAIEVRPVREDPLASVLEQVFREEWGRVAGIARRLPR